MNRLKINILGNPKMEYNGEDIAEKLSSKSIGLLSYLLVEGRAGINREKVAYMFWETSKDEAAKYNLRYNLWAINKLIRVEKDKIDSSLLKCDKNQIKFSEDIELYADIDEFKKIYNSNNELKIEDLITLKRLYKGDFLEGFYLKNCFKFNDWVFYEREKGQKKYFEVLNKMKEYYEKENNYMKQISILEEMIRINSFDEELYVELINIYISQGDRAAALNQYNRCTFILRQELNLAPKASTKNLLFKIKTVDKEGNKTRGTSKVKRDKDLDYNIEYMSEEELNKTLECNRKINSRTILVECSSFTNLNYYFLATLIDIIIEEYDKNIFNTFDNEMLRELNRVNPLVEYDKSEKYIMYSNDLEKIRIYQAVKQLLKIITFEENLNIFIKNIEHIDRHSFEFIKFISINAKLKNIDIKYTGDINDEKAIELNRFSR
ncbi:MAG: bacterial transcriptional activator domain-containing protein [Alkaliphilus sp.]